MRRPSLQLDRGAALARFHANRARTRALFDMLDPRFYAARPIPLRNPVVFYEGHVAAFAVNTLLKKGLGRRGVDPRLETVFARGIDPADEAAAVARGGVTVWPARDEVLRFVAACDELAARAIDDPASEGLEHVGTILEHEEMHQETLLYMLHRLPYRAKARDVAERAFGVRAGRAIPLRGASRAAAPPVAIPAGEARLGVRRGDLPFAWDNEYEAHEVLVGAFEIDADDVTNAQYQEFVDETGSPAPAFWERHDGAWFWRGQFEPVPLDEAGDRPVYVTHRQATAYARWRGARLPTEAEWHRAADAAGLGGPPTFGFDPRPVGTAGTGAVRDLAANGWEWTSSVFGPFPGFRPMTSYPEYSAEFFDGDHFVLKGASPVTPPALVRPSLRNWFRPDYPYVYGAFRCVREAA